MSVVKKPIFDLAIGCKYYSSREKYQYNEVKVEDAASRISQVDLDKIEASGIVYGRFHLSYRPAYL